MENRNLLFGIIGLLILVVIGVAVDRANQFTTLTDQANLAATEAQTEKDNLAATIEAQSEAVAQSAGEVEALSTQMAVSSTEFEAQIAELSDASTVLENNNMDFATQVADLSGQNDALQSSLDEASASANPLQTQVAESNMMIATLEADNQVLMEQVDSLMPTGMPTAAPTLEVDTSAPDATELNFAFQVAMKTRGVIQISPDSRSVAILSDDNVIELVSAVDGTHQLSIDGFDGDLSDFIYASNGRSMAAIMDNNTVIVFDSATGASSFEQKSANPVKGYDFSSDNNAIAIGNARSLELTVFDSSRSQTRQGGVTSLDWSDDGSQIVLSSGRVVTVLDISDYSISGTTDLNTDGLQVVDVTFSPDGAYIAGTTVNSELVVLSAASGSVVWQTTIAADNISDIAWSSDSAHIAVVAEGDISVYGIDGSWVASTTLDGVTSVAWSSDGAFLAFASADQVSVVATTDLLK
jgi:dipeptidyl aminopeptidase/acylaminoacyl peptidase